MSATLRIDRLSLHAGPLSEAEGRRLAELVGLALGRLSPQVAGPVGDLSVTVPAGKGVEQLAEAVVRAVEAALRADGAT